MPRRPEPSDRFEEVDESQAEDGDVQDPAADELYGEPDVRNDTVEEPGQESQDETEDTPA